MKTRPILPIFLCFILGCQTPPSPKSGERSGAEYSERHLDFKEWGRTADCCTASGVKAAVASGGGFASKAGIEILKQGDVRRAKLYYLRNLTGKASRIKEKFDFIDSVNTKNESVN